MTPHGKSATMLPTIDVERLVDALFHARSRTSIADEDAPRPIVLPSRDALARALDGLRAALFPAHAAAIVDREEGIDQRVRAALWRALPVLTEEIRAELSMPGYVSDEVDAKLSSFCLGLPVLRAMLAVDAAAAYDGDPAARSTHEVLLCYPGFDAIVHHRIAHALHGLGLPLVSRMIAEIAHSRTGIDIHPGATIDAGFFIDHGTGVVIGETARIGKRVRIYQGVTLGAKSFALDARGAPIKGLPRHPILEDDVVVYAGATILGRVTIGRGSSIGGNVWLTRSVPAGSRITQAQLRFDLFDDGGGI